MSLIKVDPARLAAKKSEEVSRNRAQAYKTESDPLFFKAQRGESTIQEWLDKIIEIKNRFPKE
jgi:hypothetical protein